MVLEYLKAQKTQVKRTTFLSLSGHSGIERCYSDSGRMHFFISNPFQEDFETKWKDMG